MLANKINRITNYCFGRKSVKIYRKDLKKNLCILTVQAHSFHITSITKLNDGKIASSSWDNTIKIGDLSANQYMLKIKGHSFFKTS